MNFTRGKHYIKKTRFNIGTNAIKGINYLIRNFIVSMITFLIFVFSTNLLIKSLIGKINLNLPEIYFLNFNQPKFLLIESNNYYAIYKNGTIKLIENNIDNFNLPLISGISIDEKNEKKKKILKDILAIDKKFFNEISEINIKDTENIIILTLEGKKFFLGNNINKEKMENLYIVQRKIKEMKIAYKTGILLNNEKVIIKKEGK